jgi:AcrR family transcriptional regulator
MRQRIIETAHARFSHFGYGKTTIADIAEDLGVSTAYIYKFFASKVAINEAVANDILGRLDADVWKVARGPGSASDRLRAIYHKLLEESVNRFFHERKLHDMVAAACDNSWAAVERYKQALETIVAHVVREGRAAGEFETESDEAETVCGVFMTLVPFGNPYILEEYIDTDHKHRADCVANLVLKGLKR